MLICRRCNGSGYNRYSGDRCSACDGVGYHTVAWPLIVLVSVILGCAFALYLIQRISDK